MNGDPKEPWRAGLEKMRTVARCGAHARTTEQPCQNAAMDNGRCRMHGGKSPGSPCGKAHGNFRHGLRTKEAMAELRTLRSAVAMLRKIIDGSGE